VYVRVRVPGTVRDPQTMVLPHGQTSDFENLGRFYSGVELKFAKT
jgi:hypothetical protein